ncbi:helix-turn-helix domain-containing protein [Aneurinibacillus terranovensis]|uniref:helix-turn-helix domain-containing protein n=1 Tax=Aneurinibacillus terranovensis TaxID=278991 RepID=UPI000428FFAA|nr:helix-turn-helix domain-containing protein [Aneurinibacillus terranovensis]
MSETYAYGIVLLLAERFAGNRSPRALVHLLKGRKNHQVIQDAALFGVSLLYGFFSSLTYEEIEGLVKETIVRGWTAIRADKRNGIEKGLRNETIVCTETGEERLRKWEETYHYESGLRVIQSVHDRRRAVRFWKRLELLVQTLSYLSQRDRKFSPVVEERIIQQDVKYLIGHHEPLELSRNLKREIAEWMTRLEDWEQQILLFRLSGRNKTGLTYPQLAHRLGKSADFVRFHLLRLAAERLAQVTNGFSTTDERQADSNPCLFFLLGAQEQAAALSETSRKTKQMLDAGLSLDEIGHRRRLKKGTVEDHVVEIAIADPAFDITRFVTREKIAYIHRIMRERNTRKLGEIKKITGEFCTFLEIRLACTCREAAVEGVDAK